MIPCDLESFYLSLVDYGRALAPAFLYQQLSISSLLLNLGAPTRQSGNERGASVELRSCAVLQEPTCW
jgi:hypothetical protein